MLESETIIIQVSGICIRYTHHRRQRGPTEEIVSPEGNIPQQLGQGR